MSNNKFSSLNKAVFEQIKLPDDAVVADLGCRDAGFLVELQQVFPNKIHQAVFQNGKKIFQDQKDD